MKRSVSRWEDIVSASERGEKIWVGVDVHKEKYAVGVLTELGVQFHYSTSSDNKALVRQFLDRKICVTGLAYESGPTGFSLCRVCRAAGINAIVAAVSRTPRPAGKTAKNDRIDCMKLAEYLAKKLLKPVTIPSEEEEAFRAKVRRRNQVTKEVTRQKNQIKSFLLAKGLPEPEGLKYWSCAGMVELKEMVLLPDLRIVLDSSIRMLEWLEEEERRMEKSLCASLCSIKDVLQTVPGVGPITSAHFRAEIFDPHRFKTADTLCAYLGLAPIVNQSGNSRGHAQIVPNGQGKLRSMLVESALTLRRHEQWASDFYNRVLHNSGKGAIAIVALARKLAVLLWRLWLENREYQSQYGRDITVKDVAAEAS